MDSIQVVSVILLCAMNIFWILMWHSSERKRLNLRYLLYKLCLGEAKIVKGEVECNCDKCRKKREESP